MPNSTRITSIVSKNSLKSIRGGDVLRSTHKVGDELVDGAGSVTFEITNNHGLTQVHRSDTYIAQKQFGGITIVQGSSSTSFGQESVSLNHVYSTAPALITPIQSHDVDFSRGISDQKLQSVFLGHSFFNIPKINARSIHDIIFVRFTAAVKSPIIEEELTLGVYYGTKPKFQETKTFAKEAGMIEEMTFSCMLICDEDAMANDMTVRFTSLNYVEMFGLQATVVPISFTMS